MPKDGDNGEIGEYYQITIDTDIGDIVKWDREEKRLLFAYEVGKFKKLSDSEVDRLSHWSKLLYTQALQMNKQRIKYEKNPSTPGLHVSSRLIPPSEKLEVIYTDEFLNKWHPFWGRADSHNKYLRDGYTTVRYDDGVETFAKGLGAGEIPRIGTAHEDEMVLYKIPKEEAKRREQAAGEKSRRRMGAVEEGTIEQMRQAGGKEFVPGEGQDGRAWSGTDGSGMD